MEIFNQSDNNQKNNSSMIEEIRGSSFILAAKLVTIFFLFDGLYIASYYFFNLGYSLPFDLHHHIALTLLFVLLIKIALQIYFILSTVLSWIHTTYCFTDKHFIQKYGIFHIKEDVFLFDHVRSIVIDQSFWGRLFNYGNITLKTSASGGYQKAITLMGITNPQKYVQTLKDHFRSYGVLYSRM